MTKLEILDGEAWVEVGITIIDITATTSTHRNVGTIGHVDFGKSTLQSAVRSSVNSNRGNKSDRKRNRKDRWR